MYGAFEREAEPADLTIAEVLTGFVPLSKLMQEQITGFVQMGGGPGPACHIADAGTEAAEAGGVGDPEEGAEKKGPEWSFLLRTNRP